MSLPKIVGRRQRLDQRAGRGLIQRSWPGVVGSGACCLRKVGFWGREAEADLPGLALPVQVFTLAVVLTMWEAQQRAAAASTSG